MSRATDPAATLTWLRAPKPALTPKQFVTDQGHVRYSRLMQSSRNHWRSAYLIDATCELGDCGTRGDASVLFFDHCHRHGWIRAVLCNAHNSRLGHIEAVWLECAVDLSGTPYGAILGNCLECRP